MSEAQFSYRPMSRVLIVATIGENIIIETNCRNVDGDRANSLDPLFETRDSLIKVPHKRRSCRNFKNKIVRFTNSVTIVYVAALYVAALLYRHYWP